MSATICSVGGCDKPKSSRGLCPGHYERWRTHGDAFPEIPLAKNNRGPSPHGTNNRYTNTGCHCGRCKKAHARDTRETSRARLKAYVRLSQEYPDRFQDLLSEERERLSLRPGAGRPSLLEAV